MNKFVFTGNLTRDAELKYTTNEKAYSKFTVANNEGYGDNEKTTFINCTLWGKSAENLNRFLIKGKKILVSGKVEINSYKDKEGIERKTMEVNVDMFGGIELLGGRIEQQENNTYEAPANNYSSSMNEELTPVDDGTVPF